MTYFLRTLARFAIGAMAAPTLLTLVAPAAAQPADPARATVQTLDDGLLTIMKGGAGLGSAGRAAKIAPVVDQTFDIGLITRLSVGAPWTTIAPADQAALVAATRRMTIAQYAANFSGYSGESFTIDPKVEVRGTDRLVRTTLVQPKDSPVSIGYRLRETGGRWRIIDVYYRNSISQLATRRSDFETVLAKGGAKALIAHLDQLGTKAAH